SEPQAAAAMLDDIAASTNETLEELRDLARGIYPPLLGDKGLVAALEADLRKSGLDAALAVGDGLREHRFPRSVETTCYFCVREALDNVARHANNAPTWVTIEHINDALSFVVHDQGPGFNVSEKAWGSGLQSMSDRIAAAGGRLQVDSAAGAGTTITGRIPLHSHTADQSVVEPAAVTSSA
ncbi:MAG: hypothetical protein M3214_10845, partial [Actinomycetota bacterium]|nr:hypothetical protein [Actinomycetota bacterium]